MGSRLYPPMRERIPGFRINPNSPLYRDLKIAPFDPAIGRWCQEIPTRLYGEWYYMYYDWEEGYQPSVRWYRPWRRHVAFGSLEGSGLRIIPPPSFILPTEEFSIFWMARVYGNSPGWSDPFMITDSSFYYTIKLALRYSSSPQAKLNTTTISGNYSHESMVVRYRPGTNQFQWWGNGVLYAQDTATLPTWANNDVLFLWSTEIWGSYSSVFADLMYWTRALTDNEIVAISDVNNIDYRLSNAGPPLLLPPARKYFPVATVGEAEPETKKIPWHLFFAGTSI